jgi:hypothetical protein
MHRPQPTHTHTHVHTRTLFYSSTAQPHAYSIILYLLYSAFRSSWFKSSGYMCTLGREYFRMFDHSGLWSLPRQGTDPSQPGCQSASQPDNSSRYHSQRAGVQERDPPWNRGYHPFASEKRTASKAIPKVLSPRKVSLLGIHRCGYQITARRK